MSISLTACSRCCCCLVDDDGCEEEEEDGKKEEEDVPAEEEAKEEGYVEEEGEEEEEEAATACPTICCALSCICRSMRVAFLCVCSSAFFNESIESWAVCRERWYSSRARREASVHICKDTLEDGGEGGDVSECVYPYDTHAMNDKIGEGGEGGEGGDEEEEEEGEEMD